MVWRLIATRALIVQSSKCGPTTDTTTNETMHVILQ